MFKNICALILALGVFYMGIMYLNQYSREYSKVKKTIRKKTSSLISNFLKSAGITALASDSGKLVTYSSALFCYSGVMNFETAFVCILGCSLTSATSSFLALIQEQDIIFLTIGIGGIMSFFLRRSQNEKLKLIAMFLSSIGLLLFGIHLIKDNSEFLSNITVLKYFLTEFHNPFLVLLAGTAVSMLIQSTAGFVFMIMGIWGSHLLTYEQSILLLYGGCLSSCIKGYLYALPFKGSARRLILIRANLVVMGSITVIGFYFLEKYTSIPLLNSLLNSIYKNVVFEVSGAMVVSVTFFILLHLIFKHPFVFLYSKLYPDDAEEALVKTQYIQNIACSPEREWSELLNKEIGRIITVLLYVIDIESKKNPVNMTNIINSNDMILERMLDLHKYLYEGKTHNTSEAYLLYEKLFHLKKFNSKIARYYEIVEQSNTSSKSILKIAVIAHIALIMKYLSDLANNGVNNSMIEMIMKSLDFNDRKAQVLNILEKVNDEYTTKFELISIYNDMLASLKSIINSYLQHTLKTEYIA